MQDSFSSQQQVDVSKERVRWHAPAPVTYKCNVDGAWKERRGGIGVLFRDSKGAVLASGIFPVDSASSPLHVEVLAVLKGLEMAESFNFSRCSMETDCSAVIHGVKNLAMDKSCFGHCFTEI